MSRVSRIRPPGWFDEVAERNLLSNLGRGSGVARIWRLMRGSRTLALGQAGLSLVEGAIEATILTLFARISLTAVTDASQTVAIPLIGGRGISTTLLVLAVLIVLRLAFGSLGAITVGQLQFRMMMSIRSEVVNSYSQGSWRSQAGLEEGGLQQLVVTLPNKASASISGLLKSFGQILVMVAMIGYALFANTVLTTSLMAAILAASLAFMPLRRWIKSQSGQVLERQRFVSSATAEFSAMKLEVQAFGIGARMATSLRNLILREGLLTRRLNIAKSMVPPLYSTMTYSAVTLGLIVLQGTAAEGLDEIGPILLIVLRSLAYGQGVQQVAIAIASLIPILDFLQNQTETFHSRKLEWGNKGLKVVSRVEADNVSVSYSEASGHALRDAVFTIDRGERVGIVGPSGSGKSTLVRTLLGITPADSGCVLVNGSPLYEYDRAMWSQRVGFVPQYAQVFRGTLADNLRMYRDGVSDEDLWWALEIADFACHVQALPHGLDTKLGSGAHALSGGQQQRLAIARALVSRPDFVVMDEPTSSIDALSEAAVSDALERLPDYVMVLIVSHRMRILQDCDRLVVIESAEITDDGPTKDVINSNSYLEMTQAI